jgi:hypothetical protein
MQRAFNLIEQIADVVEVQTRPQISQVPDDDLELSGALRFRPIHQTAPDRVVNDITKGPPRTSRFSPQLGRNIVIQCQSGSHVMMLMLRHHDVNCRALLHQGHVKVLQVFDPIGNVFGRGLHGLRGLART